MPRVSVIMAAYNAAPYVQAAVQSVRAQTIRDWELIAVDDGSTDETGRLLDAIADSRVRVVRRSNGGPAAARQTGLLFASGEILVNQDADDLAHPRRLERQLAAMDRSDAVYVRPFNLSAAGEVLGPRCYRRPFDDTEPALWQLAAGVCLADMTGMYGRRMLERVGGWNTALRGGTEIDLAVRLARAGARLRVVPELLYYYRCNPAGVVRSRTADVARGFAQARLMALEAVSRDGPHTPDRVAAIARILPELVEGIEGAAEVELCRRALSLYRLLPRSARPVAAGWRLHKLMARLRLRAAWPRLHAAWRRCRAGLSGGHAATALHLHEGHSCHASR
jgi:hypothetical protein